MPPAILPQNRLRGNVAEGLGLGLGLGRWLGGIGPAMLADVVVLPSGAGFRPGWC